MDLLLHVHRFHPGVDAEPERWPDGEVVVWSDPADWLAPVQVS